MGAGCNVRRHQGSERKQQRRSAQRCCQDGCIGRFWVSEGKSLDQLTGKQPNCGAGGECCAGNRSLHHFVHTNLHQYDFAGCRPVMKVRLNPNENSASSDLS